MKNKKILMASLLVIVVILVGGLFFKTKDNKITADLVSQNKETTATQKSTQVAEPEARCDALLTLEEADSTSGLAYSKRDVSGQATEKN